MPIQLESESVTVLKPEMRGNKINSFLIPWPINGGGPDAQEIPTLSNRPQK